MTNLILSLFLPTYFVSSFFLFFSSEIYVFEFLFCIGIDLIRGFSGGSVGKILPASAGDTGSIPGSRRFPREGKWQPTPVFLPGKSHGRRSLVGCSPWGRTESDKTEATWQQQPMQETQVQCLGQEDSLEKENGNPLQYSCL